MQKRLDPQDDMVSFLCDVHYEALDRKLTDLEIAGIVHAMIIGGLETTVQCSGASAQLRIPSAVLRRMTRSAAVWTYRWRRFRS